MADTTTETDPRNGADWAEKIGASALSCLRDMVAAMECDYDRLEELRGEKAEWIANDGGDDDEQSRTAEEWVKEFPDEAEELAELEEAAGECPDRDDAEDRIHQDPLSIQVRSDWKDSAESFTASEFMILLSTGGPATRIMGELDEHGEPHRAWLEVQDWFKPWTEFHAAGAADVCLAYARCFTFASDPG